MRFPNFGRFPTAFLDAIPSLLPAIDTDLEGLDDSVETNTCAYISPGNTGTSPTNPDSDGDGAGDWYEVTASFTNPTTADSRQRSSSATPRGESAHYQSKGTYELE